MRFPLFIIGAIVLITFAIIATAAATQEFLSVTWTTWLCASALSYLVSLVVDPLIAAEA